MKYKKANLHSIFFCCVLLLLSACNINQIKKIDAKDIQDISLSYQLPQGVSLSHIQNAKKELEAWKLDVDMNNPQLLVRPYRATSSAYIEELTAQYHAIAAINGGFFSGESPVSTVIYPNEVVAKNLDKFLGLDGHWYQVTRGIFALDQNYHSSVNWVYHFGDNIAELYKFDHAQAYDKNHQQVLKAPSKAEGQPYSDILFGIGGGPILITDGKKVASYYQEALWESGAESEQKHPRTAIGYTLDNHIIIFIADGRRAGARGLNLTELQDIMYNFACYGAINLDGGSSTGLAIGGQLINHPVERRKLPVIVAITSGERTKYTK